AGDLDVENEKVQEVRSICQDKPKKKASSSSVRSKSSIVAPAIVEQLVYKWKNVALGLCSQRKEAANSYLQLKQR
nr:hypothetical protein [Tanacetum cinerariifolium]